MDLPHSAPDLEAMLPTTIAGEPVIAYSLGGAELAANPATASIVGLAESIDGDAARMALALGNTGAAATANVFAIRVGGADGTGLLDAYVQAAIDSGQSLSSTEASVGGRTVTRLASPDTNPLGDAWVYAKDDTVFGVQSKDEALVEEILGQMP